MSSCVSAFLWSITRIISIMQQIRNIKIAPLKSRWRNLQNKILFPSFYDWFNIYWPWSVWDGVEEVEVFLVVVTAVVREEERNDGVVLVEEGESHPPTLTWHWLTSCHTWFVSTDYKQQTGRQIFNFNKKIFFYGLGSNCPMVVKSFTDIWGGNVLPYIQTVLLLFFLFLLIFLKKIYNKIRH